LIPNDTDMRLIQVTEQLEDPVGVLATTYTTATWQNQTLDASKRVAHGDWTNGLTDLGWRLGLAGFPSEVAHHDTRLGTTAFQYLEIHDHERFICQFGMRAADEPVLREGDRAR
jgi:maltooligosyltrehalose trehalohydrolase